MYFLKQNINDFPTKLIVNVFLNFHQSLRLFLGFF